eukprot:GHVS01026008.1.p1 GENE.GHVS01026008.1~~GHVS01026008.1.p1  ORF type:complete len:488 (-),score=80.55 GHVS01026008.1:243-1706(-)
MTNKMYSSASSPTSQITVQLLSSSACSTSPSTPESPSRLIPSFSSASLPSPSTCPHPPPLPSMFGVPLKYVALILLVAQTVAVVITLRFSRIAAAASSTPYINTTAVAVSEILKLICCLPIVWYENKFNFTNTAKQLHREVFGKPTETLKVGLPAILYTIQNNLIFVSLSNLSGAMYQVTYQLKILTTALLSVLLLNKRLGRNKWTALVILTIGVVFIQVPTDSKSLQDIFNPKGNTFLGLVAVLSACCTSGLAGVYFEMILKQSQTSIWLRNIQLALYGSALGIFGAYWNDGEQIRKGGGFLQGYDATVWAVVVLQAVGGLIVAAVLKYADNILKCFGNAISIIMSCLLSYYILNDFQPSWCFVIGTCFVILATYTYSVEIKPTATTSSSMAGGGGFFGKLFRRFVVPIGRRAGWKKHQGDEKGEHIVVGQHQEGVEGGCSKGGGGGAVVGGGGRHRTIGYAEELHHNIVNGTTTTAQTPPPQPPR